MNRNIYLVGYRGSGKSTVGAIVADRLRRDFADADTLLESQAGKTIREIFATEGEPAFRDRESATLRDLALQAPQVVATGGGVVLRAENRELLRRGWVVWLRADPFELWRRIQADGSTAARRPDLAQGGLAEIESLLAVREPLYREVAHIEVDVAGKSPEAVADAILAAWTSPTPTSSGPLPSSSSA